MRPPGTETATSPRGTASAVAEAGALINARRFGEATRFLEEELRSLPGDPELEYLLGVAAYRSGNDGVAGAAFERSVASDPRHVDAWLGVGRVAQRSGRRDSARRAFQAALAVDPANAAARRYLAEVEAGTSTGAAAPAAPGGPPVDPAVRSLAEILDARGEPRPDEVALAGPLVWAGRPSLRSISGAVVAAGVIVWVVPPLVHGLATALPGGPLRSVVAALWRAVEAASWPAALFLLAAQFAGLLTRRYVLHKHRVDLYAGLLNREHVTLWLHDLERPVLVRQSLWSLALRLASVELDSTILRPLRRRRSRGLPGRVLLSGLPAGLAEEVGGLIRAESLWQRRRMVQNFVSSR